MKCLLILVFLSSITHLSAQVDASDSAVQNNLIMASQYLAGSGRPKDDAKAMSLYLKCAEQGSPKAMNALGVMNNEGIGTTVNRINAIKYFTKSGQAGSVQGWYNLGLLFKDAKDSTRDYSKAFEYFGKAVALGDDQSEYAQAYMLYKGLGCTQNYALAANLFTKGAIKGRSNSMYFLGLCYRNGYGVHKNVETAKYWLTKASQQGSKMALDELNEKFAENDNREAKDLASKLKATYLVNTSNSNLNHYTKLEQNIPAHAIEGSYKGFIIRYDWSGKYAINSSTLVLDIFYKDGELVGVWKEGDSIVVPLRAMLTPSAIVFKNTKYSKTDHYSPVIGIPYQFEKAKLQWVRKDSVVYLAGNIQMFSPKRNEPEKPLFISLTRNANNNDNNALIDLTNDDGSQLLKKENLNAYPNPFNDVITVQFELKERCKVETQLLTFDGKLVYKNDAGLLDAGSYILPLHPSQHIAPGNYLIVLHYGAKAKSVKIVKL